MPIGFITPWHDHCLHQLWQKHNRLQGRDKTSRRRQGDVATESEARNALAKAQDPELGQGVVDLGMVRDLQITEGSASFTLKI
jgi:hypothetical protein